MWLTFCSILRFNLVHCYMDCDMDCDRSQVVYRKHMEYTDKLLALRARRVASSGVALRAPPSLASPLVPTARLALTRSRNRTLRVLFHYFLFHVLDCDMRLRRILCNKSACHRTLRVLFHYLLQLAGLWHGLWRSQVAGIVRTWSIQTSGCGAPLLRRGPPQSGEGSCFALATSFSLAV
jgi:hypothetical protein